VVFPYILHKEEAKKLGIKFFFSGIPCRNGHSMPRYTSTHMCLGCRRMHENTRIRSDPERHRIKGRKWYAANREKACSRVKAYHAKDPERHRAKARAWNKANPERHRENIRRSLEKRKRS